MENVQSMSGASQGPLLDFITAQQELVVMLALFGGMLLFMVLEQLLPREESAEVPVSRWLTNWFLAFFNYFLVLGLMSFLGTSQWIQAHLPTLAFPAQAPTFLVLIALILAVEFLTYLAHRLFHAVPFLWRIHAVHHMDTELDVTTAHRHHFLEAIIMALLITPVFLLFGLPLWIALAYQLLRVFVLELNHSNLRVPEPLERALGPFIVTGSFHRVHHSSDSALTNSNYGSVVPWFDYLFGTVHRGAQENTAPLGLEYLQTRKDGRFHRVLLLPFMWRSWGLKT